MIITVTMNPAIDRSIRVSQAQLGAVQRVDETREDMGGKGINVSRVLTFFGRKTIATGILGEENSARFSQSVKAEGIRNDFLLAPGSVRTNIKVQETQVGRTTDFNEKGIEVSTEILSLFEKKLEVLLKNADTLVLAGSLPKGTPEDYYGFLIKRLSKKVKVAVDAAGSSLLAAIENGAAIIKPNIEELEAAYGTRLSTEEELVAICKTLIRTTRLEQILLTRGADGAMYFDEEQILKGLPVPVEVKNTVSAGDSFLAGFLSALDEGESTKSAFARAIACGTLAVTMPGTEIFSREDYDQMIQKVQIRKI